MKREKKILANQCRAAVELFARCPPHKCKTFMKGAVALRRMPFDSPDEAELEGMREEKFVSTILDSTDKSVAPRDCANVRCNAAFISVEYNRHGDAFRCPHCNKYSSGSKVVHSARDATAHGDEFPPYFPRPGSLLRTFEKLANAVFSEYGKLYYGADSTASAFVFVGDEDEQEQERSERLPKKFGLAAYFHSRVKRHAEQDEHHSAGSEGEPIDSAWNTSHVVTIEQQQQQEQQQGGAEANYVYTITSKVYLDVFSKRRSDEDGSAGGKTIRFSGFMNNSFHEFEHRATSQSTSLLEADGKHVLHLSQIGDRIQEIENHLRDTVSLLYFGKGWEAVTTLVALDSKYVKSKMMGMESEHHEEQHQQQQEDEHQHEAEQNGQGQAASLPQPSAPWVIAEDEQGNQYYYNEETGDAVWELPEAGTQDQQAEDAGEGEGEEQETSVLELSLEDVLGPISFSVPFEEYVSKLKAAGVKSVKRLLLRCTSDDYLSQTVGITVYGDRRKILKWVGKNQVFEIE